MDLNPDHLWFKKKPASRPCRYLVLNQSWTDLSVHLMVALEEKSSELLQFIPKIHYQ